MEKMGAKEKLALTTEEKKRLMTLYFLKRWSMLEISEKTMIPPTSLYKWKLQFEDEFSQVKDDEALKEKYLKEAEDITSVVRKSKAKLKRKTDKTSKVKPSKEEKEATTSHSVDVYIPQPVEEEQQRIQTKEQIQLNELNQKLDVQVQDALFIKNTFLTHLKEINKTHETMTLQLVEEKNKQLAYSEQRIKQLEEENSRLKTLISTLIA